MSHFRIVSGVLCSLAFGVTLCGVEADADSIEHTSIRQESNTVVPDGANNLNGNQVVTESGVMGVRSANKFAFNYKKRFSDYDGQIANALGKGWINQTQADEFKSRLSQLKNDESALEAKGYPKAELDELDKNVTKFNMDLTNAQQSAAPKS